MEKIKYQKIENFENKKKNVLNAIKNEHGGVLPSGYDNDLFMSALIKIIEHLEKNYKTTIKAKDIPDVKSFTRQKEQYSITSFVLNRTLKNVNSVNIYDIDKRDLHRMGGYAIHKDGTRDVTLYKTPLNNNLKYLKSCGIDKKFESESDFENTLLEEVMIHELIHAISDNGKKVGFNNSADDVALNEGMTENLALEIAGLKNFSNTLFKSGEQNFAIKTQTYSGYQYETNIFNLIRVASKEDMTIPYLVDTDKIRFGYIEKFDLYKGAPLNEIKRLLNKSNKEIDQVIEEQYNPITDKNILVNNNNFVPFQELQTILIEDIFANKYNKDFLDKIRKTGKAPTKEEYDRFKRDLVIIGRCIVPTLSYKFDTDEKKDYSKTDHFAKSKDVMKLIQNKVIEPTKNVLRYRDLLFAVENIEKDFANELTI